MHLLYKLLTMHVCTINLKYFLGINYPPHTHTHTIFRKCGLFSKCRQRSNFRKLFPTIVNRYFGLKKDSLDMKPK